MIDVCQKLCIVRNPHLLRIEAATLQCRQSVECIDTTTTLKPQSYSRRRFRLISSRPFKTAMIGSWFLLTLAFPLCTSWDLDRLVPDYAALADVAVLDTRAFLALPRLWRDPRKPPGDAVYSQERRHTGPTLVEAPWPEPLNNSTGVKRRRSRRMPQSPRAFPGVSHQVMGDCSALQSVIGLELDRQRGRLWVLDSGEASCGCCPCTPKVVVFNLRINQQILVRPLAGVPGSDLSGFALDAVRNPGDTRAYIGYPGGGALIVVSWRERSWWRMRLSGLGAGLPLLPRPTISPYPAGQAAVPSWDLVVVKKGRRSPKLVISARDSDVLFDVFLSELRDHTPPEEERNFISPHGEVVTIHRMGSKLGPSTGLVADAQGALHYFLVRDAAAVRWDPQRGVGAEAHDVLLQDPTQLPLAGAFFLDAAKNVWAAAATFNTTVELQPTGCSGNCTCPPMPMFEEPQPETPRQDENSSEEMGDWSSEESEDEEDVEIGEVDNNVKPPAKGQDNGASTRRRRFALWRSKHVRPEDEDDARDTVIMFTRKQRSHGTQSEIVFKDLSNSNTSLDARLDVDAAEIDGSSDLAPVHCVLLQKGQHPRKAFKKQ